MVKREQWIRLIEQAWAEKPIVWLAGVRRSGKTFLCKSLEDAEYFDCELPRVRRLMDEDPEAFLAGLAGKKIILDEIHRLARPSELLKIAADHFPGLKIVATGSSTLGAVKKFRDTLTGRKRNVLLTPATFQDLSDFGVRDIRKRFLHGGLPPFMLADALPERDFQEWMDSYWAKDILELFRLERRDSFLKFVEMVLARSGGLFEATAFSGPCEVSRATISNYLEVLETTLVAHVIRPFSSRKSTEIISIPKVYGFDTGFVCYFRGWHELRRDDMGLLWEHVVLNELQAALQGTALNYWRDKSGHEVDFVLAGRGVAPTAIECKMSSSGFDPAGLAAFRQRYPDGLNVVVCEDVANGYERAFGGLKIRFENLQGLKCRVLFHP
jgi:predicted AAA+ superfamily ATPase